MKYVTGKRNYLITALLIISMVLTLTEGGKGREANAAETGTVSKNIHYEDYHGFYNWADNIQSYLFQNQDGSVSRVEAVKGAEEMSVVVENYDAETFTLQSSRTLEMELPLFGGFFAGETYNYLVFGQENPNEDDDVEVFRIVQYDKEWNRIGSDGLFGANTTVPFDAGSLRMCEYGDMIYVRTSHEMYQSSDGSNHQSNVTFSLRQSTCKITDSFTGIGSINYKGYVSHSFNQFIRTDGNVLLGVDHGDAYPRAIAMTRYIQPAGQDQFIGNYNTCTSVNVLEFPGNTGANFTGAEVGGFEVSSSDYLVAYQTVDQQNDFGKWESVRNVYVGTVDKDSFPTTDDTGKTPVIENIPITSYTADGSESASNPVLVKMSEDAFLLMWEVYDAQNLNFWQPDKKGTGKIQYVMLDAAGHKTGEIQTMEGALSDCQPIVMDNQVLWYVTDNSAPTFYTLDPTAVPNPDATPSTAPDASSSPVPGVTPSTAPDAAASPVPGATPSIAPDATASSAPLGKVVITTCKKKGKKKAKVVWKKVAGCVGYQVQYSVKANFKQKKQVRVAKTKKQVVLSGLKANKKYYIRVRAYRSKEKPLSGPWSKVYSIK